MKQNEPVLNYRILRILREPNPKSSPTITTTMFPLHTKKNKKCHVLDSTQQKKHNALREREIPVTVSRTWRAITRSPGSATLTRAHVSNSRLRGSNLTPTNTFRPPSPSPINFIGRIIQCFLFSLSCIVAFILGIAR